MKKRMSAVVASVLAVGCGDMVTDLPMDSGMPSFAVADGAHGGNEHFFFLPPLVPSPTSFNGDFNPGLTPTIEVHFLADTADVRCRPTTNPIETFTDVSVDQVGEVYSRGWPTGGSNLTSGQAYRICAHVFGNELGYRDVQPDENGADIPRNPDQLPILQFNNGSNLPIKFRIESQALCTRGVIDCTEMVIGSGGGTAVCDDALCGVEIQPGAVDQDFLFIVELLDCPLDGNGNVDYINADIPQYPGCLDITIEPKDQFSQLAIPGLAAACYDAPGLTHAQRGLLQLHHRRDDGTIEALPNAPAPFLDCSNFQAIARGASSLEIYARNTWRAVKNALTPRPLNATDRGFGGRGFPEASPFVWGLPSQMSHPSWTNPEVGDVGEVKTATVFVADEDGNPVENATVRFDVTQGSGPPTGQVVGLTDALGVASTDWTFGPSGLIRLEASGLGVGLAPGAPGTHLLNTPPGGSGVFASHLTTVVDLGIGVLNFDGVACNSSATATIDGSVGIGEYSNSQSFMAKVSGGESPATVHWGNDCHNFYLAIEVGADDALANDLRVMFDNDGDGVGESGDDVAFFEKTKSGARVYHDRYRPDSCKGNKQSDCSEDDPSSLDGTASFGHVSGTSTYELSKPLRSGDTAHDFQLNFGDTTGFYLVLQLGKGAQGNTEFPGHEIYIPMTISIP
jgi:hypothetical protein